MLSGTSKNSHFPGVKSFYNLSGDQAESQIRGRYGIGRERKPIRAWSATYASVHEGQEFIKLPYGNNSYKEVLADSAYLSGDRAGELAGLVYHSRMRRKRVRGAELSEPGERENPRPRQGAACV